MNKSFFILLLCCVRFVTLPAQVSLPSLTFQKEWKGDFKDFDVDHLGNIYLLSSSQQLKKLNPKGDSVAVFNDVKSYGNLSKIDVSNPLKVLLYYKQFTAAVVLDRFLNINNQMNLRKQGLFMVQQLTPSFDNHYWLFDEQRFTLKKINDAGATLLESNDFRQVFGQPIVPIEILDRDGQVYLNTKDKGIYVFDYYGTFKASYDVIGLTQLTVEEGKIYGFKKGKLISYDVQSGTTITTDLPIEINGANKLKITKGKLYALTSKGLSVFDL